MTKVFSYLVAQAILIQMVFSQNSNFNPSTSASPGKGPLSGPINTNPVGPAGSNNKGLFAGAVGPSFNKGPAIGPINSISGPINSNLLGPVGSNNKGSFAGALGTSGFGFGAATYGPAQYGPGPYGPNQYGPGSYGPVAPFTSTGSGNVAVNGELPVAGNTGVSGQVPVTGTVQFNGKVPASGAVTITGICSCGAPGFYGF